MNELGKTTSDPPPPPRPPENNKPSDRSEQPNRTDASKKDDNSTASLDSNRNSNGVPNLSAEAKLVCDVDRTPSATSTQDTSTKGFIDPNPAATAKAEAWLSASAAKPEVTSVPLASPNGGIPASFNTEKISPNVQSVGMSGADGTCRPATLGNEVAVSAGRSPTNAVESQPLTRLVEARSIDSSGAGGAGSALLDGTGGARGAGGAGGINGQVVETSDTVRDLTKLQENVNVITVPEVADVTTERATHSSASSASLVGDGGMSTVQGTSDLGMTPGSPVNQRNMEGTDTDLRSDSRTPEEKIAHALQPEGDLGLHPVTLLDGMALITGAVIEQKAMGVAAPRDAAGLVQLIQGAYSEVGGISITTIGSDADRHVIVSISGTNPNRFLARGGEDPNDLATNARNAVGATTLKGAAVREAMIEAGVTPSDRVLLTGHSQGGADAIRFAADETNAATLNIVGVVTFGAPEVLNHPSSIPVMEIRAPGDPVPMAPALPAIGTLLDISSGRALPEVAVPPNVQIIELAGSRSFNPFQNHGLENYIDKIGSADGSGLSNFVHANPGFFSGAQATTRTFSVWRAGRDHQSE